MKMIKLTNAYTNEPIYVNIDQIGHIYQVPAKIEYGKEMRTYSQVGVTTHNNGGLSVVENTEQIIRMIKAKETE